MLHDKKVLDMELTPGDTIQNIRNAYVHHKDFPYWRRAT
jgi:hypothetical protein